MEPLSVAEEVERIIAEIEPRYSETARQYLRYFAGRIRWAEEDARKCDLGGAILQLLYAGASLGSISSELTMADYSRIMRAVEKLAGVFGACGGKG